VSAQAATQSWCPTFSAFASHPGPQWTRWSPRTLRKIHLPNQDH
jgi:hypothetical protein